MEFLNEGAGRPAAPTLAEPKDTVEVIKKYGFSFQKRYGQNFLIDAKVLDKIVGAAELDGRDFVLEIGPGIGTLTQRLACKAGKVCAVEIDRRLTEILEDTLAPYDNTFIVNDDIMHVDIRRFVEEQAAGAPVKVVANLPYYITTSVIMRLLECGLSAKCMVFMVQKEVAGRIMAEPGSKEYGALTLAVQYHADAELAANVPQNCFMPRPGVDSAVIKLKCRERAGVDVNDEKFMFEIIRASFEQRRKTLANGLYNAPDLNIAKTVTEAALEEMGLDGSIRGEKLSLAQFAQLSNLLKTHRQLGSKPVGSDYDRR